MVRLKKGQEAFEIVDGPDAGLKFERNKTYDQAPLGYEDRFEKVAQVEVPDPAPAVKPKSRKGDES
jgi:hypothetical protein